MVFTATLTQGLSNTRSLPTNVKRGLSFSRESSSGLDKRLREFFENRNYFRASQSVVESVLSQECINGLCQPLLFPIYDSSNEHLCYRHQYNNHDDDAHDPKLMDVCDNDDEKLFDILYETTSKRSKEGYKGEDDMTKTNVIIAKPRGRKKGQSFKVKVAYRGRDFCGWQIQAAGCNLPSVQETIINRLDPILNVNPNKPLDVRVCGRTDSGVSAIGQYCRVRTVRDDVRVEDVQKAINDGISHDNHTGMASLLCTNVEQVSEKFHPTFDASCRAYVYLMDAPPLVALCQELACGNVALKDVVSIMDSMLGRMQGETLDYIAFSYGKVKTENTLCRLSHVRARIVETNCGEQKMMAVAIELVGDRFLRRMVRILVATAVREVLLVFQEMRGDRLETMDEMTQRRLLSIVEKKDRSNTAKAAASDGLIFVDARFRVKE
jgi:Pseudouridylate synthase